jgi:hypothetical protein
MRRGILTVLIVAVLSGWINHVERAVGTAPRQPEWIRTTYGWEPRRVLAATHRVREPSLHPATVAGFQLSASLTGLLLFARRPQGEMAW